MSSQSVQVEFDKDFAETWRKQTEQFFQDPSVPPRIVHRASISLDLDGQVLHKVRVLFSDGTSAAWLESATEVAEHAMVLTMQLDASFQALAEWEKA
jgi:hypothetical protein